MGIIAGGRLLEVGTFDELRARHPGNDTLEDIFLALVAAPA
ncbi:MAG: imidazolonepropionase-like domain-containing protein [Janthinobacterium lividum]